jgi:hypothetical protein
MTRNEKVAITFAVAALLGLVYLYGKDKINEYFKKRNPSSN